MRLTAFTDYSIRTLIYLGLRPKKLVTIAEIANAYGVSANHLMKVVQQLAQAGDVTTLRGQHGGMRLARPAAEIRLGVVIRRAEPDLEIVACFGSGACRIKGECGASIVLAEALQAFLAVLDRYTVADLLTNHREPLSGLLGISDPPYPVAAARPSATEMA